MASVAPLVQLGRGVNGVGAPSCSFFWYRAFWGVVAVVVGKSEGKTLAPFGSVWGATPYFKTHPHQYQILPGWKQPTMAAYNAGACRQPEAARMLGRGPTDPARWGDMTRLSQPGWPVSFLADKVVSTF